MVRTQVGFDVVVIGGGLAGLAAALSCARRGLTVCALERELELGGLARTLRRATQHGVFSADITGHFLHSRSTRLSDEVPGLLKGLAPCERRSMARIGAGSDALHVAAPVQSHLGQLPEPIRAQIRDELLTLPAAPATQESRLGDYLRNSYGPWLGSLLLSLNAKTYGPECADFRLSQYNRFFPHVDRENMLAQLTDLGAGATAYNHTFLYSGPQSETPGIGILADRLVDAVEKEPLATLHCSAEVEGWDFVSRTVRCTDGRAFRANTLVTTMPLRRFLNLDPSADVPRPELQGRSLQWWWVGGRRQGAYAPLRGSHWTYFTDPGLACFRAGVFSNVDPRMSPPGCYSAWLEFAAGARPDPSCAAALCEAIGLSTSGDGLLFCEEHQIDDAYCFENPEVQEVLEELRRQRVHAIGRAGQWAYLSMEDVILQGLDVGAAIARS